jgi:hypothetical protein
LEDAGGGVPVKAPIFDYANFERLEHEGWRKFGGQIERLREQLSGLSRE